MGRKLDPTNKVKRGPGKKAKKQQGAETELVKFIDDGDYCALYYFTLKIHTMVFNKKHFVFLTASLWLVGKSISCLFADETGPKRMSSRGRKR